MISVYLNSLLFCNHLIKKYTTSRDSTLIKVIKNNDIEIVKL